uniref:Ig-like domain-containing protein n=2 Tax=Amphimedon queenslandica TaxID=400682 RepID=A0A1X7TPE9_AMPQE
MQGTGSVCSMWRTEAFTITSYNITVYPTIGFVAMVEPLTAIKANRTVLKPGEALHLDCITTQQEFEEIIWLHRKEGDSGNNFTVIGTTEDTTFIIDNVTYEDSGLYMCQVILGERGNLSASACIEVIIGDSPVILNHNKSQDVYLDRYDPLISDSESVLDLHCSPRGYPTPAITWYRNGQALGNSSRSITICSGTQGSFAVYQCIAVNEFGRDSVLIRVLVRGLANPVGDITITPKVQDEITQELYVSWTPPVQRGGVSSLVYNVNVYYADPIFGDEQLSTKNIMDGSSSATIRLQLRDALEFRVYQIEVLVYRVRLTGRKAAYECIDTKIPYYLQDTPPLTFDCETGNMSVLWEPHNPSSFKNFGDVSLKASCLYKGMNHMSKFEELELMEPNYRNDSFMSFLQPGTVCQFYGNYRTPDSDCQGDSPLNYYREVPIRHCEVKIDTIPEDEGLHLKIFQNISNDTVTLHWRAEKEIVCNETPFSESTHVPLEISGECRYKDEVKSHMATVNITNKLEGIVSFILPSHDYICSFTAIINEANTTYESSVHIASGHPIQSAYFYKPTPPEFCNHNIATTSSGDDGIISSSQTPVTSVTSITESSTSSNKPSTGSSTILIATPSLAPSLSTTSGGAASPLITSMTVVFSIVISVLVFILVFLFVVLCLRQRKKRLMFEIFNEETHNGYNSSYNFLMEWSGADNVSIKTEIQSPSYATSTTAMASMSSGSVEMLEISCQIEAMRNKENETEADKDNESINTIFKEDWTDTSSKHTLSFSPLPATNDEIPDCHVQVDTNGFTYQVKNDATVEQETSACSSGYGSQITASSCSPSQDYHDSIVPDLEEAQSTNTKKLKDVPEVDESQVDECFVTDLRSFSRSPSLEDNKSHEQSDPATCSAPVIISESLKGLQDLGSSVSSNESLSREKIHFYCHHETEDGASRDNLTNVLYVDEKGYIRFICKETS